MQEQNLSTICNIAYVDKNGNSHINASSKPSNIDAIPYPLWDAFPMESYALSTIGINQSNNSRGMQLISSRGCINKCTFCHRIGKGERFRKVFNVVSEMKYLYDFYNVTYFTFLDELLIVSLDRLKEFARCLELFDLLGKIKFNAGGIRSNVVTDEIASLFEHIGCQYMTIGFESMSEDVLKKMRKNVTPEDNIRCLEILRKHKIHVGINFIWGMPGDTEKTLRQNADTLKKYNTYGELRTIRPVTPYPGSELFTIAVEQGMLLGPDDFFNKFNNSDLISVNFTDLPIEKMYECLFEINSELIIDHHEHIGGNPEEDIKHLYDLYFNDFTSFRGFRKYERKE